MSLDGERVHLAASDNANIWRSACGQEIDPVLLSQSTMDVECGMCRRTRRFRDVAAEEAQP